MISIIFRELRPCRYYAGLGMSRRSTDVGARVLVEPPTAVGTCSDVQMSWRVSGTKAYRSAKRRFVLDVCAEAPLVGVFAIVPDLSRSSSVCSFGCTGRGSRASRSGGSGWSSGASARMPCVHRLLPAAIRFRSLLSRGETGRNYRR